MHIDVRGRFRWITGRKYLVLRITDDRRTKQVSVSEEKRKNSPLVVLFVAGTVFLWASAGTLILTGVTAYLAKSRLGIDLMRGRSPIPALMWQIGFCRMCHKVGDCDPWKSNPPRARDHRQPQDPESAGLQAPAAGRPASN